MVRQAKAKKPEYLFGKGKVTPTQIAYVVDQYLSEHQFIQTRSSFRSEASSLISKTPVQEGPKMMSLETIIDEYVKMKEQKLIVEMEKQRLEQESSRVNSLLHGMQSVMNAYNAAGAAAASVPALDAAPVALSDKSIAVVQHSDLTNASPAGQIVNVTPNTTPPWVPPNMLQGSTSFTTPVDGNPCSKKRRGSEVVPDAPINAKKSRTRVPSKKIVGGNSLQTQQQPSTLQSSTRGCAASVSPVQGSSVAKVLFQKTTTASAAQNSSCPVTPPRALSGQSDKNVSPAGHSSSTNSSSKSSPPDFASNSTIVSTKTLILSPFKQAIYYSVEKNCSSTCSPAKGDSQRPIKRDHVKGRLNFDGADETTSLEKSTADESSTSESDVANIFDFDLPNLDFNISDLLVDFDLHCEGLDASGQPASTSLNAAVSGLDRHSIETASSGAQIFPETSSAATQVLNGTDSHTGMKLVSQCIKISSPGSLPQQQSARALFQRTHPCRSDSLHYRNI